MRPKSGLFAGECGLALVEFAIILALIVLSAAAAMLLVGDESARTFARLDGMGEKEPRAANVPAQSTETDNRTVDEAPLTTASQDVREAMRLDVRVLTLIFGGTAIVAYVLIRRQRPRRTRAVEELDDARELLERVDGKRFAKRQDILRAMADDPQSLVENRLEVRHVMSKDLHNVRPKTPLDEIKAIMSDENVRHFPVVS
jgi:CBS domain-containing protein